MKKIKINIKIKCNKISRNEIEKILILHRRAYGNAVVKCLTRCQKIAEPLYLLARALKAPTYFPCPFTPIPLLILVSIFFP